MQKAGTATMSTRTRVTIRTAAFGFGLLVLLCGCAPFHSLFGEVRLSLGTGGGAKTILPVIEVDSYLIAFSGPAAVDPVSTTQANPTIELPAGTWDISVAGKDTGGDTVAVGGASGVVVSGGATTPVAIVLNAQASGTGTIDVTVTWPVGLIPPVDSDRTTVTLDEAAVNPGTLTFGSTWVRYVEAKPAGSYRLCLTLVSVATPRASVQEAVQVYGNLTSSAIFALTSDDFLLPPTPPGGLAVAEGLGALELSWTDTSHVETGYVVERSTTGLPLDFYALGSPLPANTEGYHDADASASVTYWYRVKAMNSLGDSGYSNVGSGKVEAPVAGASGALSFSATTTSSIRVSWVKGTDNVSAQAVLGYRVVRSLADDVGTVAEALANGTVVLDWTPDVATVNATGLASGTAYYFNVLARDEAGNTTAWVSGSRATATGTGQIGFTITVTSPSDEPITFDRADDITVGTAAMLAITIGEGFDSYSWMLDGATLQGQEAANVTVDCGTLDPGVHHVTAFVTKNGLLYSRGLRFVIEN